MARLWITYCWADNDKRDIDFIANELADAGLDVRLDRWDLQAGCRLWEQIEGFICGEGQSDAWLLVATQNSLASEPCKEEFAYALDRALNARGKNFPVVALFLSDTDNSLIPAGIRTRLHVSITDPDWKERILASAEGRLLNVERPEIEPYHLLVHNQIVGDRSLVIEVRPRAGTWAPFFAAILQHEKNSVEPGIMHGASNRPTGSGMLLGCGEGTTNDGKFFIMFAENQATPTQSYYIYCKKLPSFLAFGVNGGHPRYEVTFGKGV